MKITYLLLCAFVICFAQDTFAVSSADKPPGYAVASAHPLATNAGLEILAQGGNAFDAAIAVSAALAVVEPYHSGLGGGGFWLLHVNKEKRDIFIDARETAPLAAHKDMFLAPNGEPIAGLSLNGGLAAAIPGEPAALAYLAKHYGRLPLTKSLAPAIRLAERGFIVDYQFNYFSTMDDRLQQLQRFPATAAVLLHDGKAWQAGELLRQPDLAHTLRVLAEKGHDGFYKGEVAEKLVAGAKAGGGVWSLADLANYRVKIRQPLQGAYHNMVIVTAPPPSAGGVALLTMLNILAGYPLDTFSETMRVHYLVEAMRLAYWQRADFLADPDFVDVPVEKLISADNARALRAYISPDRATENSKLTNGQQPVSNTSTTHIAILDSEGNAVSATMTVNYIFGSSVIAAGTGVLLNDEMDDFSIKPGVRNVFGIVGSKTNTIAPGKRPLSSMTPSFLQMPGRFAIVGTPGGSRIPTMVLLASLTFAEYKGAISMVAAMRFHHQYLPDWLQFEPETFSPKVIAELKAMGYQLMALKQYYGDMQAITWDKKDNLLTAASDPRHIGLAGSVTVNQDSYGADH